MRRLLPFPALLRSALASLLPGGLVAALATALVAALVALPGPATAATPPAGASTPDEPVLAPVTATGCPATPAPGQVTCLSEVLTASGEDARTVRSAALPSARQARPYVTRSKSNSYTPADLASLYRIPPDLRPTDTIGIVDVGRDPNTEAQMSYFRSYFGLPACTSLSGCFREVAQDGSANLPGTDSDWVIETALDVQAVSGVCPTCRILLVDAKSAGIVDMAKATLTATRLGARYVSLSYGSTESMATSALRSTYYNDPDVTYVAAAGDSGYGSALFPAAAPNIVAAGGTSVRLVNGVWQQSAWSGSGSGCSSQHAMPTAQGAASLGSVCDGRRAVSDLSALADPATGMLFYRGGSWWRAGGTSLAAPIVTALYALAGNHTAPLSVYGAASALVDVTSGSTGSCSSARLCSAGPGWDGPTGLGTPAGLEALAAGNRLPAYVDGTTAQLSGGGGYPAKLSYRLVDAATGAAVPAASVLLQRRLAGGSFRDVRSGSTDPRGAVAFTDRPTKRATYRVVFAGDVIHQAVTSNEVATAKFRPRVKVSRLAGRLRARVRTPWGQALRSSTVRLQQRSGRIWVSVRKLRTDRRGVVVAGVARGATYRLRYGGGAWEVGHTDALKAR